MTQFIAQALSLYFFIMGIAMIKNRKRFVDVYNQVGESAPLVFFSGIIALIIGILIVISHNHWYWELPVLVTLAGWLAFIKGSCLLIVPNFFVSLFKGVFTPTRIAIVGGCLIVMSFIFLLIE